MLDQRLNYDQFNLVYAPSTLAPVFPYLGRTQFVDVTANIALGQLDGPNTARIVFGSAGSNTMTGGALEDRLYGNAGNDTLTGGLGADYLEGGVGTDSYIAVGNDTIFDLDNQGTITFNGVPLVGGPRIAGDFWKSADGRFRFAKNAEQTPPSLVITDTQTGEGLEVLAYSFTPVLAANSTSAAPSQVNSFGIVLEDSQNPVPSTQTTAPEDTTINGRRENYTGGNLSDLVKSGAQPATGSAPNYDYAITVGGNDVVFLGPGDDRVLLGNDADTGFGEDGDDYMRGGPNSGDATLSAADTDVLSGGAGKDLLAGGIGGDLLIGGSQTDNIASGGSNAQGDWLMSGLGDDLLVGSVEKDFINGGAGRDSATAGSGDDLILGDGDYDFNLAPSTVSFTNINPGAAAEHSYNTTLGAWETRASGLLPNGQSMEIVLTPNNHFEWSWGLNGDNFSFSSTVARPAAQLLRLAPAGGNDVLRGGAGDDWIAGQTGADTLFGDAGSDRIYGDDFVSMSAADSGNDRIFGGEGNDRLFGNLGADEINGDAGDDRIQGDDAVLTGEPDRLFGGSGVDEILAGGGDDFIDAGDGNDLVVSGDSGNDFIIGGAGNDVLQGDGPGATGNDSLYGGEGNDTLRGNDGDDLLFGGEGSDQLLGEAGADTLSGGLGTDQLNGGEGNDNYLAAIAEDQSGPSITNIIDSGGLDRITFPIGVFPGTVRAETVGSDSIVRFGGDAIRIVGGASGGVIEQFAFFDGRVLTLPLSPSRQALNPSIIGMLPASSNSETIFRSGFEVELYVTPIEQPTQFADRLLGTSAK